MARLMARNIGIYLGYTQKNLRTDPTLYFQNGRLTQQHVNKANIGWHPIGTGVTVKHYNIKRAHAIKYLAWKNGRRSRPSFFDKILSGQFRDSRHPSNQLELYFIGNKLDRTHISRSPFYHGLPRSPLRYTPEIVRQLAQEAAVARKDFDKWNVPQ